MTIEHKVPVAVSEKISLLPASLQKQTMLRFEQLLATGLELDFIDNNIGQQLVKAVTCSEFIAQSFINRPGLIEDLLASGDLLRIKNRQDYSHAFAKLSVDNVIESTMMSELRQIRRRESIRIAWRDINSLSATEDTLMELSLLAEVCIEVAAHYVEQGLQKISGVPVTKAGVPQSLLIVAMGKLGGHELNFSSDIDLIFAYAESGTFKTGKKGEYLQYFQRFGQQLIHLLSSHTEDGFVYRVDMRLRPYGDSGSLVMSLAAIEEYYQSQGREWERYALIKARVVFGDHSTGDEFNKVIQPFVYRRYLDYGAFESLREMKRMISLQVKNKDLEKNIKLGAGGIREIEFTGQAFQLVRGGTNPQLQTCRLIDVLNHLADAGCLQRATVAILIESYYFLRRVENLLQEMDEQQVHSLPDDIGKQAKLAFAMGYEHGDQLAAVIKQTREQIHQIFLQIFTAPEPNEIAGATSENDPFSRIWTEAENRGLATTLLSSYPFKDPAEISRLLNIFRHSRQYRSLSGIAQQRVDKLLPIVIRICAGSESADEVFIRVLGLIEKITTRSAYISLLIENPDSLQQLVKLFGLSSWIAAQLVSTPALLDELLDSRMLYSPLGLKELKQSLAIRLKHIDEHDLETQMEVLRNFKQSNILRIAAVDISNIMPLLEVSDNLTYIAETILDAVLKMAWQHMVERHGVPETGVTEKNSDHQDDICGFAIVAYGKMGGFELGYGSDLDLVFLHRSNVVNGNTNGPRPIENTLFYARLAQRIIHILTTRTATGILYEVDTRLRPNGLSGVLVSAIEVFSDYQHHEAWTWEHQALIRSRVVAGDPVIAQQFDHCRQSVLAKPRDTDKLKAEVTTMREQMRHKFGSKDKQTFLIKQDRGGLTDIEFIVQFTSLNYAQQFPEIIKYTDVFRQLKAHKHFELLADADIEVLLTSFQRYRSCLHRLTLRELSPQVPASQFRIQQKSVAEVWNRVMKR